jgi:uncharacterized protein YegP (UPF0339 family)
MTEFINKCKAFAGTCIAYVKENPLHGIVLAALVLLLILTICVAIARSKSKKRAKKSENTENTAQKVNKKEAKKASQKAAQKANEQAQRMSMEEKRQLELKANAEARAKKATEEKARQDAIRKEVEAKLEAQRLAAEQEELALAAQNAKEEPVVETAETVETVNEPAPEKPKKDAKAEVKAEEKPKKSAPKAKSEPAQKKSATVLFDELKDAESEDDVWYDEDETDKAAKYKGKWLICRMITNDESEEEMYFFELHASNGEKLLSSEEYTTYAGAIRGIATHKTNIAKGNFKITLSKKGDYIFKLLSGKNMLLCMGENYPTRARCESAIESTVRFAETAVIDENVQDHVVKVPVENDTETVPPVIPNGKGKWIISAMKDADGEEVFYFELYANNGEKLLSSEEYTTYIGAVNGISTHKANIEKDNFRITLTKRGDYIYKLLNGNGQLLCLGEHYKAKRLCQNAVDSVKRFAKNSPILTDSKIVKS